MNRILLLCSIMAFTNATAGDRTDDENKVRALLKTYFNAHASVYDNPENRATLLNDIRSLYEEDSVFFTFEPRVLDGRDEVMSIYNEDLGSATSEFRDKGFKIVSIIFRDNLAFVRSAGLVERIFKETGRKTTMKTDLFHVLRKQADGEWKIFVFKTTVPQTIEELMKGITAESADYWRK
jgi:ketosteroid isomerase-like protein